MSQHINIVAYQVGEKIHLKDFKAVYEDGIYSGTSTEIFIKKGEYSYIYLQNSGEVAFSDCSEQVVAEFLRYINRFVEAPVAKGKEFKEDFVIEVRPGSQVSFNYNSLRVPQIDAEVIKIAMLVVIQSVLLDYFTYVSQTLLAETGKFTRELELRGKLGIGKTSLMKFIGKTLNTQNQIIDDLYFIDAPDTVWENEYLAQINNGLSKTFNLRTRFREVEYTLRIIDKNLGIFAQLVQHRDSNKLELVVIFLILLEVVNVLFFRR